MRPIPGLHVLRTRSSGSQQPPDGIKPPSLPNFGPEPPVSQPCPTHLIGLPAYAVRVHTAPYPQPADGYRDTAPAIEAGRQPVDGGLYTVPAARWIESNFYSAGQPILQLD